MGFGGLDKMVTINFMVIHMMFVDVYEHVHQVDV